VEISKLEGKCFDCEVGEKGIKPEYNLACKVPIYYINDENKCIYFPGKVRYILQKLD
jgi:hypothetical protein